MESRIREGGADEAYEEDEDRWRERIAARSWALLSMIVGCLLVVVAMAGSKSEAIYLMDKVVRIDTAGPFGDELDGASRILTTMSLVHMLLFVGLIVVFISFLGITATQGRHKCLAAIYAFSSASCAVVILMMSMQILQRISVVQPVMARQVEHLCNASTYIQMGTALKCSWASKYPHAPPCGVACAWKAKLLQSGCRVMPQLCESFEYEAQRRNMAVTPMILFGVCALFVVGILRKKHFNLSIYFVVLGSCVLKLILNLPATTSRESV